MDVSSRAHAFEGQCFVVAASLYVPRSAAEGAGLGNASWDFFGESGIVNPSGEYVAGPLHDQEGIVYGEIDLSLIPLRKATIDTTRRDSAWETISMSLDPSPRSPIAWRNTPQPARSENGASEVPGDSNVPSGFGIRP